MARSYGGGGGGANNMYSLSWGHKRKRSHRNSIIVLPVEKGGQRKRFDFSEEPKNLSLNEFPTCLILAFKKRLEIGT